MTAGPGETGLSRIPDDASSPSVVGGHRLALVAAEKTRRSDPAARVTSRATGLLHAACMRPAPAPAPDAGGSGLPLRLFLTGTDGHSTLEVCVQVSRQLALRLSPVVAFYQVEIEEAEELLIAWRHPLHLPDDEYPAGRPYTRPFGSMGFVMEDRGRQAAAVVLASTVNASVCKLRGWHRYNTVDLARIARSPDRRDKQCLRAVLRIARDYLAPLWLGTYPRWDARSAELCGQPQIEALSSTSLPGTPGQLYRFDGFERIRVSKGAKGGGHQRPSAANAIADGARGLWVYPYPQPITAARALGKPGSADRLRVGGQRYSPAGHVTGCELSR